MSPLARHALSIPLAIVIMGAIASAAMAQTTAGSSDRDEKLPAQLPSVTITGDDLSNQGRSGTGRIIPTGSNTGAGVRLPEPSQRRATNEDNRVLMVGVTPTTVESPASPAPTRLPYTALYGGWGPLTQYRAGIYDARMWGPALGLTDLEGHAGWGWSGWRAKEWIDWHDVGRLGAGAESFAWQAAGPAGNLSGSQTYMAIKAEHGDTHARHADVSYERGTAATASFPDLFTMRTALSGSWRPDTGLGNEHAPLLRATLQHRVWGIQTGAEGYFQLADDWALSDQVSLQGSLGGGYWGREPILDPGVQFHWRPAGASDLYAGLRTASELPDFQALYQRRPATAPNANLQSERVEGWAEVGGSHRLTEQVWGKLAFDLRRSWRHIYWTDLDADGLWMPTNAANEQWSPGLDGRVELQWASYLRQNLRYRWRGVYPLAFAENRLGTTLDAELAPWLNLPLSLSAGLDGRFASLSTLQVATGGQASGVFAEAEARYALSPDLSLSLTLADLPVTLSQTTARNYFAPAPLFTLNAQYVF